jgi:hypothetical protein
MRVYITNEHIDLSIECETINTSNNVMRFLKDRETIFELTNIDKFNINISKEEQQWKLM